MTRCRCPTELGVEAPAYLNGLAEAASELRRHILDCLRADQLERAEMLLATMDDVYGLLVTIDFPDALTGGLRRTTDALRAVIERTRGDLTNALVAARLRAAIARCGSALLRRRIGRNRTLGGERREDPARWRLPSSWCSWPRRARQLRGGGPGNEGLVVTVGVGRRRR